MTEHDRPGADDAPVEATDAADVDGTEPGGLAGLLRRSPMAVTAGALGLAFLLLAGGALAAGMAVGAPAPQPTPTSAAPVDPERAEPDTVAQPTRLRTCSIAGPAADPLLHDFLGRVENAQTGEVLWDRRGAEPVRQASVLKVLTSAAALAVLGSGYRISTRVVDAGSQTVALVGRGDATLSATPAGTESVYAGAPKLADLAAQTVAAFALRHPGERIETVTLDATWWSDADKWDPSWARTEQTLGYHSEVTALQVDGDRADPTQQTSPRSTDPIGRAGDAFVAALRAADPDGAVVAEELEIERGLAPAGQTLGEVQSQPVSVLIGQLLLPSDNTLAEMLARIVSKESGHGGAAMSLQDTFTTALAGYGVATTGIVIRDGSGLSAENAVPASYLTALLAKVQAGERQLAVIRDTLPVSGETGTLASRFTAGNEDARGAVRAKSGWIDSAYTLAGIITARDGTVLTFSFAAVADGITADTKVALDTITTAVFRCGDNLSAT